MAKIKFSNVKISGIRMQRLQLINSIIEEYQAKGYTVTLRQLYYRLVGRDIIENTINEYGKLSSLLKDGRMAGIVDWDAIEDRLRKPYVPFNVEGPSDAMDVIIRSFACNRQLHQPKFVEVWVEKDALSGVLSRVTAKYHIPIMVNRGYSSATAMFAAYNRFKDALINDQEVVILYLGDFDPSGLDMIRDVRGRIIEFLLSSVEARKYFEGIIDNLKEVREAYLEKTVEYVEVNPNVDIEDDHQMFDVMYMLWLEDQFTVRPIALTENQIEKYDLPPNPAKFADPRAKEYVAKYGKASWEVDALEPEVLHQLLDTTLLDYMDKEKYEAMLEEEKKGKATLVKLKESLK